jgi:hypothetical protein
VRVGGVDRKGGPDVAHQRGVGARP